MSEGRIQSQFEEVKDADALFKGTISLEYSGYWPLSNTEAREKTLQLPPEEIHPGLLEYMAACIPFRQVFTHGDCGIFAKAYTLVNKKESSIVNPIEENKITPHPKLLKLVVANIHKNYDAEALDRVLTACKEKNPQIVPYLFKGEKIAPQLKEKHNFLQLEFTWTQFLENKEFQKYYQEKLARLFKETHRWPQAIDFKNRKEFAWLDKAVKQYYHIQVYGGVGVGKTALLAKLADKISKNQTVVWVNIDFPNISKAEILISMAQQLGIIESPRILEHPDPANLLRSLEKEIQRKIETHDLLVVVDGFDPIFRQGWNTTENKELLELFSGWVSEQVFVGQMFRKSRLVFTGDIRVKEAKDTYTPLKTALSRVLKEKDQKIGLGELPAKEQKELLMRWLAPIEKESLSREELEQLLNLAGPNLRLLRLLALWACEAGSISKISNQLKAVEKAKKWQRESIVISNYLKDIQPRKKVILDTLAWVGKPVHRQVICSAPGMDESLKALISEGLIIYNKEDNTCELVYCFGSEQIKPAMDKKNKEIKKAFDSEILNFKRLGYITESQPSTAADFFSNGNILCECVSNWDLWRNAPVIYAPGLLSRARMLLRTAKAIPRATEKQKLATMATEYCEKSIQLGVQPEGSHFVCAQAMELAFPSSNEDKIETYYKKSIALQPYPDKFYSYARFIYRRSKDYKKAEITFKEAGILDKDKGKINIIGLHSFAEFYLSWPGHEKQAGTVLNRIIDKDRNPFRSYFLAARLYRQMNWRFLSVFFFEAALKENPKDIKVLNSYANACAEWKDTEKVTPSEPEPSQTEESPTPGSEEKEIPFSFTGEEKSWLTTTRAKPLSLPEESAQWAGFTMLYSLYYWKSELDPLKELGIMPSFQQDYDRLYNNTNDLLQLVNNASSQKPDLEINFQEEWFKQQGTPQDLIGYFDNQLVKYPENPVCAAFICQSLEAFSWTGTAKILKNQALTWVSPQQKQWRQYMEKSGIDILTPEGKEKFVTFLQEQNQKIKEQQQTSFSFTNQTAFNFINRFSNSWRDILKYLPWHQFTADQVPLMLGKLLELLLRLKNILADIQAQKEEALKPLGEFLQDITPLIKMIKRLSDYSYEREAN